MLKHNLIILLLSCSAFGIDKKIDTCALINLGQDCQVTYYLQKFKFRKVAYPFDWLQTYKFEGVCKAIEEDFRLFLDKSCLVYNQNPEFPQTRILNTRYNICFVHDFPTDLHEGISKENDNFGVIVPNFLDYLNNVKDKYKSRITRFQKLLVSNESVIFFRTHINPKQAEIFTSILTKKYPKLNYLLIVLHDKPELNFDWNIPKVKNFYMTKREKITGNNWWDDSEWLHIFEKINYFFQT